jgi:hypothetical protein
MYIQNKLVKTTLLAALAGIAFRAAAEEDDYGRFEPGAPATIYLTPPGYASGSGGTPPLTHQDLGKPAIFSVGDPSVDLDEWLASNPQPDDARMNVVGVGTATSGAARDSSPSRRR